MKQTAVEWLENELKKIPFINPQDAFEQAKQMEKQQKIEAYIAGSLTGCGCYDYMKKEDGEQYYNETYGGNK
jgi:hypothetical protein